MSDDETTRIRKALDFVEKFVDESGKINITYIREHVEWQEAEIERATAEVSELKERFAVLEADHERTVEAYQALLHDHIERVSANQGTDAPHSITGDEKGHATDG